MKKKYYLHLLLLGLLFFSSCRKEEDNLFDKSAAERLMEAQEEYKALLVSAENGWLMDYYAGGEGADRIGGYQIICKFEDSGKVTMAGAYTTGTYSTLGEKVESSYQITRMQGPCLSFSTYNNALHPFGDPGNETNEDGYTGDFEFVIMEASAQEVVMRGIRQKQIVVLRPMAQEKGWDEYCAEAAAVRAAIADYTRFEIRKSGTTAGFFTIWTSDSQIHDADGRGDDIIITNYVVTNSGIRLYNPLEIGDDAIEQLEWDFTSSKFTDVNTSANVEALPMTISFQQLLGTYSVTSDNFDTPVTVQIRDKGDGKTLRVSADLLYSLNPALNYEFDIQVYENNRLGIVSQTLGQNPNSGNYIKLAVATRVLILGLISSDGYSDTIPYQGIWYRSAPENAELRFLKSSTSSFFSVTTTLGFRICEFTSESGVSTSNLVSTMTATISNPIFVKQ